jgi:hypothetical protein
MLQVGDKVTAASVWTAPHERRTLDEFLAEGAAFFFFYLFDWSAT